MNEKRQLWQDKIEKISARFNADRRSKIAEIGKRLGPPEPFVVSYFADPEHGLLWKSDVLCLEDLLQASKKPEPLMLIVHSPGGFASAAERMIRVCRRYGGGRYSVIVPVMAKSAATLVCLGAGKIYMGPTAELGPVDPQVWDDQLKDLISAASYVKAFDKLCERAERSTGDTSIFQQQVQRFDRVKVEVYEREIERSKKVALDALFGSGGMWEGKKRTEAVEQRLATLTDIGVKGAHDRPIFFEELKEMGLNVEEIPHDSDLWRLLWQLYLDTHLFIYREYSHVIETKNKSIPFISQELLEPFEEADSEEGG